MGKYRWKWGYKARELFSNAVSAINEGERWVRSWGRGGGGFGSRSSTNEPCSLEAMLA